MRKKQRNTKPGQKVIDGLWLHPDGEYRYRVMESRVLHTGKTGKRNEKEAKEFVEELRAFLFLEARGHAQTQSVPEVPPPPPPKKTHGELVDLWEATKCNRSKSHRQTTVGSIRNHFPELLNTPVESITTLQVNKAMEVYMATKGVNPGRGGTPCLRDHTARGANKVLKRLRDVVRFGVAGKHVASFQFEINYLKAEEVLKHTLPLRWVDKFFSLIDRAKNPHLGMAARLMLWLGLREDEALHMYWEGINWERNTCFPGQTKTSDGKGVAMPPELKDYLWKHPDRMACGLLLPSARASRSGQEQAYQSGVTSLVVEAASWKVVFDDLGPADMQKLFNLVDQHPDINLRTLTRLMLYFGLPESWGRSIHWNDLDLDAGTYAWPIEGDQTRMVPVPIELLEWLRALPGSKDTGRVISSSMGRHKKADDDYRYGMATKAISNAWKTLSLPYLTPHRLRHSFGTIHAVELGTHIFVIQQLLRHKHVTTTQKYICVHDTVKQEAQKGWSREQRPSEKP
jgi:hypothetical protein